MDDPVNEQEWEKLYRVWQHVNKISWKDRSGMHRRMIYTINGKYAEFTWPRTGGGTCRMYEDKEVPDYLTGEDIAFLTSFNK